MSFRAARLSVVYIVFSRSYTGFRTVYRIFKRLCLQLRAIAKSCPYVCVRSQSLRRMAGHRANPTER